jgi:hypothetical protein
MIKAEFQGKTATKVVKITEDPYVQSIKIFPEKLSVLEGNDVQFHAIATLSDDSIRIISSDKVVDWEAENNRKHTGSEAIS